MNTNTDEIMVSIICTVFNHERYLEKTLQGFLMQKTSFPFEIIIHDDASTDQSAEVIQKYAKQYPELIRPIYQTENQYSKGIPFEHEFIYPQARGKYFAWCEGDDYWTDEKKLEIQVQYMEGHPNCVLIAHSGQLCYEDGVLMDEIFRPFTESKIVPMEEITSRWLFPTASILYRAELRREVIPFTKDSPCGDVPLVLYAGLHGNVYYLDRPMCVYRRGAAASLTNEWKKDIGKSISVNKRFIGMLDQFDTYTGNQYAASIDQFRISKEYNNLILMRDLKTLKTPRYHEYYGSSFKRKCIVWMKIYFPGISRMLISGSEKLRYIRCHRRQQMK